MPQLSRLHHYANAARSEAVAPRTRSVKVAKEVASLETLLPLSESSSVFVRVSSVRRSCGCGPYERGRCCQETVRCSSHGIRSRPVRQCRATAGTAASYRARQAACAGHGQRGMQQKGLVHVLAGTRCGDVVTRAPDSPRLSSRFASSLTMYHVCLDLLSRHTG